MGHSTKPRDIALFFPKGSNKTTLSILKDAHDAVESVVYDSGQHTST
jgi:hypothetical protein